MTERCTNCQGTGKLTFQSRAYEYATFDTGCDTCEGTGIHRRAFTTQRFGLDMRGERLYNETLHLARIAAEESQLYGPVGGSERAPFRDEFGIGQEKVAEIRLELATDSINGAIFEACSPEYVPEEWREMRIRQFKAGLADYRRAKFILEALAAGVDFEVAA